VRNLSPCDTQEKPKAIASTGDDFTRQPLVNEDIRAGMRVLDIRCGLL